MLNNALFFNRKYCPEVIKRERVLRVSKKRRSARGVSILIRKNCKNNIITGKLLMKAS